MAALVKLAHDAGMGTAEIMVWRMGPGLLVVAAQMWKNGQPFVPRRPGAIALRAMFGGMAMGLYFWALSTLTLLQYSVIALSQPVFVAVVAVPLLHERLRGSALVALPLALVGAGLVVVPEAVFTGAGLAAFGELPAVAAAAGVASALCSALAHTFVRRATGPADKKGRAPDSPHTVVFHFSLFVTIAATIAGLAQGELTGLPPTLTTAQSLLMLLPMSLLGVFGQLMLSAAYAARDAPVIAIVGYARIPLGLLADVLIWGAVAGASEVTGATLVVAAGWLLARSSAKPPEKPPPGGQPQGHRST